jgi:Metallo-peptidase family M12B Reprolysin-like
VSPFQVDTLRGDGEECDFVDTLVPDGLSTGALEDDGRRIDLNVVVLLDEVARVDGRAVMKEVARMYKPINIAVVSRFRRIHVEAMGTNAQGNEYVDSQKLIDLSKKAVGGKRPPGSDLVYTMTSKDLDGFTAGRADCIEGIKWPGSAFAVGKHYSFDGSEIGPLTFQRGYSATVAAHELGHLLAAEHHEATCPDGSDLEPTDDAFGVCTMMFPDIFFIGSRFGIVETTVIRKTAWTFARP